MPDTAPIPGVPLKVVVAYEDFSAGQRAVGLLKGLLQNLSDEVELQPVLWRFDLLKDLHWHKMAVTDAVHADMLVLSTSGSSHLPEAISRWLESAIALKQGDSAALVILRGEERAWTVSVQDGLVCLEKSSAEPPPVAHPDTAGKTLLTEGA